MGLMAALEFIFWVSVGIVFYTYFGYGLLLYLLVTLRRIFYPKKEPASGFTPSVALIIAAYNEEEFIEAKIENTLQLDYPKDKLKIIIITDGSTDATPDIVKKYPGI